MNCKYDGSILIAIVGQHVSVDYSRWVFVFCSVLISHIIYPCETHPFTTAPAFDVATAASSAATGRTIVYVPCKPIQSKQSNYLGKCIETSAYPFSDGASLGL